MDNIIYAFQNKIAVFLQYPLDFNRNTFILS